MLIHIYVYNSYSFFFLIFRTAETVFSQNDYLVRVDMNDILLRLDVNNKDHTALANILLDNFFHIINEDILFEFMYTSTMEHRLKVNIFILFFKQRHYN